MPDPNDFLSQHDYCNPRGAAEALEFHCPGTPAAKNMRRLISLVEEAQTLWDDGLEDLYNRYRRQQNNCQPVENIRELLKNYEAPNYSHPDVQRITDRLAEADKLIADLYQLRVELETRNDP